MKMLIKRQQLAILEMDVKKFKDMLSKTLNIGEAVSESTRVKQTSQKDADEEDIIASLVDIVDWKVFLEDLSLFKKNKAVFSFYPCDVAGFKEYVPMRAMGDSQFFEFSECLKDDGKDGVYGWSEELFLIDNVTLEMNTVMKRFINSITYNSKGKFLDVEKEVKQSAKDNKDQSDTDGNETEGP
jgi:hypothetical protein